MEKQSEVVLIGMWASAYCARVELALKLKGIPYQCIEEDLQNKSEFLLQHNPVHKKVPVLVHKGKPIAESLVILEYIDDCWNHTPKLLPEDPHERAKVRFWASFYDQKLMPSSIPIIFQRGKEQEKAVNDFTELLSVFVQGIEKDFPQRCPFFNGKTLGFLDIVVGSNFYHHEAFKEAVGVNIDLENYPTFWSWVNAMKDDSLMKETLPAHDKLVSKMKEYFKV